MRLLAQKDETAYGAGTGRADEARRMVDDLDEFGAWARNLLAATNITIDRSMMDNIKHDQESSLNRTLTT